MVMFCQVLDQLLIGGLHFGGLFRKRNAGGIHHCKIRTEGIEQFDKTDTIGRDPFSRSH